MKGGALCLTEPKPDDIYDIGKQIGEGFQSKVYEILNDSQKVVKISHRLPFHQIQDEQNDMEIANIAGTLGISPRIYFRDICRNMETNDFQSHLVMDNINGNTIRSRDELDRYIDRIMGHLDLLRQNGIQYGDIKASNFMIGTIPGYIDEETLFIIDFGSSERMEHVIAFEKDNVYQSIMGTFPITKEDRARIREENTKKQAKRAEMSIFRKSLQETKKKLRKTSNIASRNRRKSVRKRIQKKKKTRKKTRN